MIVAKTATSIIHPSRHPELDSGSKVQKVTDSERSKHSSFAQGEYRAKYNVCERSEYVQFAQGEMSCFNSC
ncbi:hypothetical protein [Pseudoalteromonas sp. Of7M-16]|uniref:hypothetical protein n=1 Tax=Pseudoalteromonas sp. Of7M-16 TaxID=2917756 RepID=UPI001EF42E64|nr:hypothetical protein [Pseudoalteromonas sp. Of7M-16]MCG7549778.1 hypothetical protein [Pseudoalteromonas sp. Of7M-16]